MKSQAPRALSEKKEGGKAERNTAFLFFQVIREGSRNKQYGMVKRSWE